MSNTRINVEDIKNQSLARFPEFVQRLVELVRIPSVSSALDQEPVRRSAQAVAELFERLGMQTQILSAPKANGEEGAPAVVARKVVSADAPTVLLYAHHDVQPAGPLDRWKSEPFEAVERDGRLYGRGTSDDKAGVIVHYGALSLLGEQCPVNVTCYIEGEEEVGSPSFRNFLEKYRDLLKADVIVVCDSDNWRVGEPALTGSLRGVVTADVHVQVGNSALHSGAFGGPILDAVTVGSMLVAGCFDEQGALKIEGLKGRLDAEVDYPEALFKEDAQLLDSYKLAGKGDLASRLWYQPSLTVIGWDQRSVAESANAIAPETNFRLSMRVAPGQDSFEAADALKRYLESNAPFGAKVQVTIEECGPSYQAQPSEAQREMQWALGEAFAHPCVEIGCGGAIPMTADFQAVLPQAQILITGVEDPATNAHSENESQDLGDLRKAIAAEALLLARLGKLV